MDFGALTTYETSDSVLEHHGWRFPPRFDTASLDAQRCREFLTDHRIDRRFDQSTARFKLIVANLQNGPHRDGIVKSASAPLPNTARRTALDQEWISEDYEHLWRNDSGGSAAIVTDTRLAFILQTPRDDRPFCSLSLTSLNNSGCGGFYVADSNYALEKLLPQGQPYLDTLPQTRKDFLVLPVAILTTHVADTVGQLTELARKLTETEKRIHSGDVKLAEQADTKLLHGYTLEHMRLHRRSNFERELAANLLLYLENYDKIYARSHHCTNPYTEVMRQKVRQQVRYSERLQYDLDNIPSRVKYVSKSIFNFVIQRDNQLTMQIAEQSRRDNLINIEIAKINVKIAEETHKDGSAMKTIAILTLIFLPGTAIASIFSMTMFSWTTATSNDVVSPWLWIYFAITVPLTLVVLVCAYVWYRRTSGNEYTRKAIDDIEKASKGLSVVTKHP